jgi:hypothetical protein
MIAGCTHIIVSSKLVVALLFAAKKSNCKNPTSLENSLRDAGEIRSDQYIKIGILPTADLTIAIQTCSVNNFLTI